MATNFRVKLGEIGRFTFIRRLVIQKRSGISIPIWNFICDALATSCKIVVNIDPVALEFKWLKGITYILSFSVVQLLTP